MGYECFEIVINFKSWANVILFVSVFYNIGELKWITVNAGI